MAALRDQIKQAWDHQVESEKKSDELKAKIKSKGSLPIGGKATKMGAGMGNKAAEKAYDSRMNNLESESEDQARRVELNKARVNGLRSSRMIAEDAARDAGRKK